MQIKKITYLTILEIIFFALILMSLIFVRYQTKIYIDNLEIYSPTLNTIQSDLVQNNLTAENQAEITGTLKNIEDITNKSLFLTMYALPLFFILVFILFQIVYWRIATKIKWKRVVLPALIQAALILLINYFLLNEVAYLLYGDSSSDLIFLIIAVVLTILITIFNFNYFIKQDTVKKTFKTFLRNKLKIWLNLVLMFVFFLIMIGIAVVIYVMTQVEISIVIPAVILAVVIFLANLHRVYLIKKMKAV